MTKQTYSSYKTIKGETAPTVRDCHGGWGNFVSQGQRIYGTDKESVSIKSVGGGQGAKTGLYKVHSLYPRSGNPKQGGTGHLTKMDGTAYCVDTGNMQGLEIKNPLKGKTEYGWHFEQNVYSEDSNCRSLKSAEGSGNKPKLIQGTQIRRLTPTECERLQGFPDGWTEGVSDTQRYKQMGNAVTVNVIQAIARRLVCTL